LTCSCSQAAREQVNPVCRTPSFQMVGDVFFVGPFLMDTPIHWAAMQYAKPII